MLHAQIYSTSSATYHSYSTGGVVHAPSATFRSTSARTHYSTHIRYSTAPMHVANGTIKTVASTITSIASDPLSNGFIPTHTQRAPGDGGIAPPDTLNSPLGDGCLEFLVVAIIYAIGLYLKKRMNDSCLNEGT